MAGTSLQRQGVPIPAKLEGPRPQATYQVTSEQRLPRQQRNPRPRATTYSATTTSVRGNRSYSPPSVSNPVAGTGMLEAEFLVALGLVVLLAFTGSAAYADKIMSVMKRGTLVCLMFFILSLISSAGNNAARIAKAFGALVVVAILITSDVGAVLTDIDNIIKNDWAGTSESANDGEAPASGSADSGTSGSVSGAAQSFINSIETQLKLQGQTGVKNPLSSAGLKTDVSNAIVSALNGIIPGSGDITKDTISKLLGL